MNWRIRQDSHLQTLRSKVLAHGHQDDGNFTTDAETKAEGRMLPHAKRRLDFILLPSKNGAGGESTCVPPMRFARSAVAVRKHLSLLSHAGKVVGRHGAAPCSA